VASEYASSGNDWHWDYYFKCPEDGLDWGGESWIKSRWSFDRIVDMRDGDLAVLYQSQEGILGLTYLAGDGRQEHGSGDFNVIDFAAAPLVALENPITIKTIKTYKGAKENVEFAGGFTQSTVFRVTKQGFEQIVLDAIRSANPGQHRELDEFLEKYHAGSGATTRPDGSKREG